MARGDQITAADFNAIQTKISNILGTGLGSKGYGQALVSSPITAGTIISKDQWDLLRYDLLNIRTHQDGFAPSIDTAVRGDYLTDEVSSIKQLYTNIIDQASNNRFNIGVGQSSIASALSDTHVVSYANSAEYVFKITFADSDEARYFFNSGSSVRITTEFTPATSTSQNTSWADLLRTTGSVDYNGNSNINFYALTQSYIQVYQAGGSSSYSANSYTVLAKCNVDDNELGGATEVTFKLVLSDAYIDPDTANPPAAPIHPPGDSVSGTMVFTIDEVVATGVLQPSGTFSIVTPVYSALSFTTA